MGSIGGKGRVKAAFTSVMEILSKQDRNAILRGEDARMSDATANLEDEKLRAEIEKLRVETARLEQDRKIGAEIGKLIAETAKITNENRWYPSVVGSGMTLAIVALVKLFL